MRLSRLKANGRADDDFLAPPNDLHMDKVRGGKSVEMAKVR